MIYAFLYMLSTAIAGVIIHMLTESISAYLILFWATLTGLIIFNIVNFNDIKHTYIKFFKQDKRILVLLNIYVAISCVSLFLLQTFFDPSSVLLLCFAFLTLIGAYKRLASGKKKIYYIHLYILLFFNVLLIFDYFDTANTVPSFELFLGVLIFGLSTYLLSKYGSTAVSERGYTSKEVLSIRFYFMLFIAFMYLYMNTKLAEIFDFEVVFTGVMVGVIAYILPILFFQKSVQTIGPAKHSLMIGMTPLVITVIEPIFTREIKFDQHLFLSASLVVIIVLPVLILGSKKSI